MKKLLILGTIGLISAIFVGSFNASDDLTSWFASASTEYQVVRVVVIGLLFGLLFSNPPRSVWFRSVLAAVGGLLGLTSFALMINYEMNVLDMIVFAEVSLILLIEALEDVRVSAPAKAVSKA